MRYVVIISLFVFSLQARAGVQNFTDEQRPQWFDAVASLGEYNTVDFTGFPTGTIITDQYESEFGITLIEGDDRVRFNPAIYLNDEFGLDGNMTATFLFSTPQRWFAVDHPDVLQIRLYRDNSLFYTSAFSGPMGVGGFNGVISDIAFDMVQVFDPTDSNVNMDDIYFGSIPAPTTLAIVMGCSLLRPSERRRACDM